MWTAEQVVTELRSRGELWEAAPGVVGLRGDAAALFDALAARIAAEAGALRAAEWRLPAAVSFDVLERGDYFASFPHWLTAAAHLGDNVEELESIARSPRPGAAAAAALDTASAALPPALCYHTYARLQNSTVAEALRMTACGTCWRHEGDRLTPLERGWAFTMREVVCVGDEDAVDAFRAGASRRVLELADALGIEGGELLVATDPFFLPTARGRALLQKMKALKQELVLPLGGGRGVAAASINHHERFFGERFHIRLPEGRAASTGCLAYGLERWLLAFLVAHGPTPAAWPDVPATASRGVSRQVVA